MEKFPAGFLKGNLNMFRTIRRKNKAISEEDTKKILLSARRGVLAVNGDDGYPYAVPVNYLYVPELNKIYIHGSAVGHKADSVRNSAKVCFTVTGEPEIRDEEWAPYVRSAVVFGSCRIIRGGGVADILRPFASKYYPSAELVEEEIRKSGKGASIFEITIEHMSGKELQER